jgi:AcrR family transcriptional regulator
MNESSAKSYHHGNLRNELLDTAEAHLSQGLEELSLRALARSVGVSQTAPYRHFSDKSELLAALASRGYRKLLDALIAAGNSAGSDSEQEMYAFAHCYVHYAVANRDLFKLMFGPALQPQGNYPELRDSARETYDLVREIMRSGIDRGQFCEEDIDYLANAAWSAVHGLATLKIDRPELFERQIDLKRQIDLGVSIFIAGIRRTD